MAANAYSPVRTLGLCFTGLDFSGNSDRAVVAYLAVQEGCLTLFSTIPVSEKDVRTRLGVLAS